MSPLIPTLLLVASSLGAQRTSSVTEALATRDVRCLNAAIGRLSSQSDQEREAAKQYLLNLGPRAEAPLVRALRRLVSDRRPRFATGTERAGMQAIAQYERSLSKGLRGGELGGQYDPVSNLTINARLAEDITGLLVKLKAKSAIPLYIDLLWGTDFVNPTPHPEVATLREMGSLAVPALIHEMENAHAVASRRRTDLGFQSIFVSSRRYAKGAKYAATSERVAPERNAGKWEADRVQEQIAEIWGGIRDERATAPLDALARSTRNPQVAEAARRAVLQIKQGPGLMKIHPSGI